MATNQQTASLSFPISRSCRADRLAILFALTGTLMATSIINLGNSGIAFFYLVYLLPLVALVFPDSSCVGSALDSRSAKIRILVAVTAIALVATTTAQLLAFKLAEPTAEIIHLLSRIAFLAYFLCAQRYLRSESLSQTLVWLRRFLIVVCAYGAYQIPARLLGFPLFLDWLRNNRSFDMYAYDASGWIGIVRATSIYAEPSQATIPILVLFILNIQVKSSAFSKVVGWLALLLFAIAGFSRTVWVALAAEALVWLLVRSGKLSRVLEKRRLAVFTATILVLVISPFWGFIDAAQSADLSAQERTGGIVVGLHMIKDAPILGFGWNSFANAVTRYENVGASASSSIDFSFIHNMVVSYIQQAGISGLLLAALPFILLVRWSTAPPWITYATLASFLVTAELGDIGYSSLTWLWLALLINMRSVSDTPLIKWRYPAWRPPYIADMSSLPHSAK